MRELHLFAGAGGGILGGILLGHTTVCAVEIDKYCRKVLLQRQRDGILPKFPIWDDIRTFDGKPWRGIAEVVCGGFPCQDISQVGKRKGITGERSGLWSEMARVVCEVRPRYVFVENSPMLTIRGLGTVLRDLAQMGYDARWCVLGASDLGANHKRERIWILAYSKHIRCSETETIGEDSGIQQKRKTREILSIYESKGTGILRSKKSGWNSQISNTRETQLHSPRTEQQQINNGLSNNSVAEWWAVEPNVGRMVDGVASRVDRIKAIGNGQVPIVAATAWRLLMEGVEK